MSSLYYIIYISQENKIKYNLTFSCLNLDKEYFSHDKLVDCC